MKILITGITGFVGRHLSRKLLKEGIKVCAIVRSQSAIEELNRKGIKCFVDNDVISDMVKYFDHEIFDGVIHLASCFLVEHKPEDIKDLINSNLLYATRVLEAASKSGVKWFINTGTFWQHYNNEQYNPVNLYAATKEAFEVIAKYYTETSNIIFVTIKLNDTFGPGDTRPKIFNLWQKAIQTGEELLTSPGEQVMDIGYIDDVIEGYLCLIWALSIDKDKELNNKSFAFYSNNRMTLKELASLFEKSTGKKIPIKWGARSYRQREVMEPQNRIPSIPGHENKAGIAGGIKSMAFIEKNESMNQKAKN